MKKINLILPLFLLLIFSWSCTDLKEELNSELPGDLARPILEENADLTSLIASVYNSFYGPYEDQARYFALQQHTSDETLGPTRGPDWDDNGIWRVLHDHTWDADHAFNLQVFNLLLEIVFNATNALSFNPSAAQEAELKFLRGYAMWSALDLWGQVPFRQPGENLLDPPTVLSGVAATDFIIGEVEATYNDLPDNSKGNSHLANKDAARALLARLYINRGAYANRTSPSFDSKDMNEVIKFCDEVINSSAGYQFTANYFDNFNRTNDLTSDELIFTLRNTGGVDVEPDFNDIQSRWYCTLHYNQNPSGWNGFTTIGEFYDKFEDTDTRRGGDYTGYTDATGSNVGLLLGQQFDENGDKRLDRKGNDLSFTKEISLVEAGANLEVTGIRVLKYVPDIITAFPAETDAVMLRYADVWLMKAEALLRNGDEPTARGMVNDLRTARGASELGSLTLDDVIDERGRELYWESIRRTDLIRFGKFLDAYTAKPATDATYLLFPIPNASLAANPELVQNPGY